MNRKCCYSGCEDCPQLIFDPLIPIELQLNDLSLDELPTIDPEDEDE